AGDRLPHLRGRRDEELVLDRPCAEQDVPVVLAGVEREVRRNGDNFCTFERKDAVELRKTEVVADREADRPVLEPRDDRLVARLLGVRLAVPVAADVHVEEMDLPVDGRELALRIEDETRVRELLPAL